MASTGRREIIWEVLMITKVLACISFAALVGCGAEKNESVTESPIPLPFFTPVSVNAATCTTHMANAGSTFMCPGQKFIVGIADQIDPFGRFESFNCCQLRAGAYPVFTAYAAHSVQGLGFGSDTVCPGHQLMKGVHFAPNGVSDAIECYGAVAGGVQIKKSASYSKEPFYTHGTTNCNANRVAVGIGDTFAADGVFDALHCRGAYR